MKGLSRTLLGGLVGSLALFGLFLSQAFSQMPRGPIYQWGKEKTVQGTIKEVQTVQGRRAGMAGIHLVVDTEEGAYTAMVGPSSILASKGYEPKQGDKVELLGSVLKINDQNVIVVKTLTSGGKTIQLRDDQGFPLWRGGPAMRGPRGGGYGPQAPVSK